VEHRAGLAADLHRLDIPARRTVRWLTVDRPALVLGSTQPEPPAATVDVVRRRSGGAAVLLRPGWVAWADVVVPAGDPLWDDDVGVAPLWLGRCWAAALQRLGVDHVDVHTGAMIRPPLSRLVCFAGLGAGEVTAGGRKVVGISQRRTREAVLFQVAVLLRWDVADTLAALGLRVPAGPTAPGPPPDPPPDPPPGPPPGPPAGPPPGPPGPPAPPAVAAAGLDELLGRRVTAAEVEGPFLATLPPATTGR
jgi:lipoate---protein ligase